MPGTQSIAGISSGLDTNAIVEAMIEFGRANAYVLEAQQAEKGNIITALKALEAKILGLKANISQLNRTSTYEKTSVTVSDSAYLSATGSGKVGTGQYDIQILSLARNHQIASQGFDDSDENDMGIGTIDFQLGNGSVRTVTIDNTNNSLIGIKNAINGMAETTDYSPETVDFVLELFASGDDRIGMQAICDVNFACYRCRVSDEQCDERRYRFGSAEEIVREERE